jgi:hypothetical protein
MYELFLRKAVPFDMAACEVRVVWDRHEHTITKAIPDWAGLAVEHIIGYRGQSDRDVSVTSHLYIVPKFKMSGVILPLPHVSS